MMPVKPERYLRPLPDPDAEPAEPVEPDGPAAQPESDLYRLVLETAMVGVLVFDGEGRITYANPAVEQMTGHAGGVLLGQSYREIDWRYTLAGEPCPLDTHPFLAALHPGAEAQKTFLRVQRADGTALTGLEVTTPLRDVAGTLLCVECSMYDVTDFQRQQEALRDSERRYQRLLDVAVEGVFQISADGHLLAANPALAGILGFGSVEELMAAMSAVGIEDSKTGQRQRLLQSLAKLGDISGFKYRTVRADGSDLWLLVTAHAQRDAAGIVCSVDGTIVDITDQKRWEEGLRRQNEYLEALHETALGLMDGHDHAEMMTAILQRAVDFAGTPHGYVYVLDPDGSGDLISGAALGAFEHTRSQRIRPGQGHTGTVYQTGEAAVVDDYSNWEGRASWFPAGTIGSIASVPLTSGGKVVGVLGVAHDTGGRRVADAEVEFLRRLAPLAALALDNAALYRRLGERLTRTQALTRLNQLVSASLDMNGVLSEITTAAARLMDAPFVTFWLVDEANQKLEMRACSDAMLGRSFPTPLRDVNDGAIGWIVQHRRPLNLPEPVTTVSKATLAWQREHDLSSFYGFPVMQNENVIAVLALSGRRPFRIGAEEEELLESLAAQAAVAIRNAGLYERLGAANAQLMDWVAELERRSEQIHLLSEMGELLQSCLSAEEAYDVLGDALGQIFPDAAGALYMLNASRSYAEALVSWSDGTGGTTVFRPDECWALRRGRIHLITHGRTSLRCRHVSGQIGPYVCVPMMAQGEATGVLHVRFPAWDDPASEAIDSGALETRQRLAQTVAEQTALALANLKLRETLRNQAIRDQLTGMYNRRYMEESLTREVHRARRAGTCLGVLMLDLDLFKRFNDTHGHAAGDMLLREVCTYLQANIRGEDIACRYGGEELTLILPDVSLEDARLRAEALRQGVSELTIFHRGSNLGGVTVSIGVAVMPQHGATGDVLLQMADAALYRAKNLGRNRVVLAGGEAPEPPADA